MSASRLLNDLHTRGVTLFVEAGRLRFRAGQGVYSPEMRQTVAEHRAELLAPPKPPSWDTEAADAELRQALAVIDATLPATWLSSAQKTVLTVMRQQLHTYHEQDDPQLFGAAGWIEAHVGRWRAESQDPIRKHNGI